MGPYQPGVTSKDPTDKDGIDDGSPGGRTTDTSGPVPGASASDFAKAFKSDPSRGKPAATTPLPGQLDPSRPHVVLPPEIQQLMHSLQGKTPSAPSAPTGQAPSAPSGAPSADQLINFLLAL